MNGFDVQSDAEAMLERQRRDIMPRITSTPRTPATPASGLLRSVQSIVISHDVIVYCIQLDVWQ